MKKFVICFLISTLFIAGINNKGFAHDEHDLHAELFKAIEVKNGTELNIVECVALAFKNSPKIRRKKYELDVAKSNVGIAKSAFFPVIGAGVGFYNENNSNKTDFKGHYREIPNVGVAVNQLVWDFGKSTANIKMEEFYKIGAEYEFMDSLCNTVFDVKHKYYEVLKAQANVVIAENNVKICKKYLQIAKNKPDKTTASFHLSRALFELSYAQTLLKNAKVNLSNAMFIDNHCDYKVANTKTFDFNNDYGYENKKFPPKFVPQPYGFDKNNALQIAYKNSPDLKVLESVKNAMIQSLKYVKRTYLPELSANVGYGYLNSNENHNNNLQVGVNLSSNVNLMELKHSIKGADAQINLADNEINLFKKDLYFEVQRAFNNLEFAEDDVPYAQNTAIKAIDNLETVEQLYKEGVLNYVALQEARKDYITALQSYIISLNFYNESLIELEEALHYHIVDIHHKSEHAVTNHANELIEHLNEALNCDEKEKSKKKSRKRKHDL